MEPQQLEKQLADLIGPRERVLTAFSGGIDSTVVAAMARKVLGRENAPVAIGDSASLSRSELLSARQLAEELDLKVIEVSPREQEDVGYQTNASDRCYYCKTNLYAALFDVAQGLDIKWIASGANTDDLGDHRPGMTAASQAGVITPLVEAEMDKQQVRQLAKHLRLSNWDKPAAACLASRIPYGTKVTTERLAQVERAEQVLADHRFTGFRIRHHEHVARIELPWDQVSRLMDRGVRESVIAGIKAASYHFVALDLEGFRSGSGNVVLREAERHEHKDGS